MSNVIWSQNDAWFGGFSGAEVNADGTEITLITDKSTLLVARMLRDQGVLSGLQQTDRRPLTHPNGGKFKEAYTDSEGLAISANGEAYISFERKHRVARLEPKSGRTRPLAGHPTFETFDINKGFEALAIHPDNTLYALPERTSARNKPFPVFAFADGKWQISHHIPRRGPFLAVGADFDSDGRLYLLERAGTPLGFRSRIRRFNLSAPDLAETTLFTSRPGRFDNLEAISVWRSKSGETRLTLISDDNFFRIQRTQIVEFALTE